MAERPFIPGCRISSFDVGVLIAGAIGALIVGSQSWWAGTVISFVVGHFFLFCNVFRIGRKPELIWAAVFVSLAGTTIITGKPEWMFTFVVSFLFASVLIYLETKKPSYHGIGWSWINPRLLEWWRTQTQEPPFSGH